MTLHIAHEPMTTIEAVRATRDCGCVTSQDPDDDTLRAVIDAASDAIASLTGLRVRGQRLVEARPCFTSGECGPTTCCSEWGIPLGDNFVSVHQVTIDGTVLDASEYRLQETLIGWDLVRVGDGTTRPPAWPASQDLWRTPDQERTFSIQFYVGIEASEHHWAERACRELVCDMLTDEKPETKRPSLAKGATSANLGGVSVTVDERRLEKLGAGALGPASQRLAAIFAAGGRRQSMVWAPELASGWALNLRVPAA